MKEIYCDGASIPNPGNTGIGVYVPSKNIRISEFRGPGTNQTAELEAIKRALDFVSPGDKILTDSKYAMNVVMGCWKAKANRRLVEEIRQYIDGMEVTFQWVRGHAGNIAQAVADELANQAALGSVDDTVTDRDRQPPRVWQLYV